MDDQFLDEVMQKLQETNLHYYEVLESIYSHEEVIFKLKPAIDFLLTNGFITSRDVGSHKYLDISSKGTKLLQEGGFVQLAKDKNDSKLYNKGSFVYAKRAYYAAIVAIIISLVAILIELYVTFRNR